ncbi:MAG TPA: hypothetical protein VFN76_02475 [Candidatus Limnocylindria bacterium]|nr:hypothetical protein [Candidatus Limnocylindria bacterium]
MTHAQRTHAGTTNAFLPAAFAALVMAAALALAIVANGVPTLPSIGSGAQTAPTIDRAAVDAGRAWQLQREQQAGIGAISDAVRQSAADWEEQRKAQSGESYKTFEEKVTEARGY